MDSAEKLVINFDDIEIMHPDAGGGNVYYYLGAPFTGTIVEFYPNGNMAGEIEVVDSHTNGRVSSFYANGQPEEEYFERYNRMYGLYRRWDEAGNLIAEHDYGLHIEDET